MALTFSILHSSRPRETETQVETLRLLGSPSGQDLRALAMTWVHFGRDQICAKVNASFPPFRHPTQVNTSLAVTLLQVLNYSARRIIYMACVHLRIDLRVLLASQRKSTCDHLRPLALPFGQGLNDHTTQT